MYIYIYIYTLYDERGSGQIKHGIYQLVSPSGFRAENVTIE